MPSLTRREAAALLFAGVASAAQPSAAYETIYAGGSLPGIRAKQYIQLIIGRDSIRLYTEPHHGRRADAPELNVMAASVTDISYGQEVHRRVGTAVAAGIASLGIGFLVVLSKSKKHYIGIVWAEGENKGGVVLQADKNEFRGIVAGLEGLTGRKAVSTDAEGK